MTEFMTREDVRQLCGTASTNKGELYYLQDRVTALLRDANHPSSWTAAVHGTDVYFVHVSTANTLSASCTCPAYIPVIWCKHVAATLFAIAARLKAEEQQGNEGGQSTSRSPMVSQSPIGTGTSARTSNKQTENAHRLLSLFRRTTKSTRPTQPTAGTLPTPNRIPLQVEFICHPESSYHGTLFKIEMKVGPQRTYVVKDIRGFLEDIEQHKPHLFTPKFTYDENDHQFQASDWAVISLLIDTIREESVYLDSLSEMRSGSVLYLRKERAMVVPPSTWQRLLPLITHTSATIEHHGVSGPLTVAEEGLPISAHLLPNDADDGYTLSFDRLEQLTVLPRYHCAVSGSQIYWLDDVQIRQLSGLKQMLWPDWRHADRVDEIPIASNQLAPFINEVVPGLRRIGTVEIVRALSSRLIEEPLAARLYLDRSDDMLLARLEFAYGDTIIQPFSPQSAAESAAASTTLSPSDTGASIVVRDLETERRIVRHLDDAGFIVEGNQLVLAGEEAIYAFVVTSLPELRGVVEIFATTAVDAVIEPHAVRPRSRIELDKTTDWLQVSFDMGDLDDKEVRQVLHSMVERKRYHRLQNGAFISLEDQAFEETRQMLDNLGVRAGDFRAGAMKAGTLQLPALRALPFIEDEPGQQSSVKLGKSLRMWLDNLRNPDNLEFALPPSLSNVLRDYQKFGFQWLKTLSQYGFGGILADDMGLGKTLQSIAYLLSERTNRKPDKPALIVCPASLTYNWLSEIERFAPELKAVVINGDQAERFAQLEHGSDVDVLITSYPLLWRDAEAYSRHTFDVLILDEAQAIKNHATQTAQAVSSIQSPRRFALTGTPVENSLDDVWSIFHAIFPALLGPRQGFSKLAPETVAKRIRPFMLRRLKRDVLTELPDKIEMLQTAEMNRDQKKHYLAYLAKLQDDTAQQLETEGFQKGRFRILAGLTRLRQICCHPALAVESYNGESGKLDLLMELVDEYIGANQRMLVFSQFTSMLAIIRDKLDERQIPYFYLDGQTPTKERLSLCQRFNTGDTPVFLISLKAGGTGLNLTGADTVILYDLWWNPAVEEQAADRAHRIGQKRTVQVVRLVTQGTIEEKMYELQEKKRALIDQVVASNANAAGDDDLESSLSALTEADIRELLAIR